jgi:hypothetical protein
MRPIRRLAGLILMFSGAIAIAQPESREGAVTLYGAYRGGGSFTDAASDQTLRLNDSSAGAISYDRGLDDSRLLQFYASYQDTHLGLDSSALAHPAPGTTATRLPIKVIYLHVGGINFVDGPIGRGPYVVGGLGATLFLPGSSGYGDEVRPSLNLGIGYQAALAEHLALRVEARGYVTLFNSRGGLFCSGGCVFKIKADTVAQGEAQLGLSYRF